MIMVGAVILRRTAAEFRDWGGDDWRSEGNGVSAVSDPAKLLSLQLSVIAVSVFLFTEEPSADVMMSPG